MKLLQSVDSLTAEICGELASALKGKCLTLSSDVLRISFPSTVPRFYSLVHSFFLARKFKAKSSANSFYFTKGSQSVVARFVLQDDKGNTLTRPYVDFKIQK